MYRTFLIKLLSVLILFSSTKSVAGGAKFIHIKPSDGLSHYRTLCIYQDRERFYWICTTDGLNRYDGRSFTSYFHSDTDTTTIPSNVVSHVTEDKNGDVLITTDKSVSKFNRSRNSFTKVFIAPIDTRNENRNSLRYTLVDAYNRLWIFSDRNVYEFDVKTGTTHLWTDSLRGMPVIYTIRESPDGNIWINNGGTLNVIETGSEPRMMDVKDRTTRRSPFSQTVYDFDFDSAGTLFVLNKEQVHLSIYDNKFHLTDSIRLPDHPFFIFRSLYVEKSEKIWLVTNGQRLFEFDRNTDKFNQYMHEDSDPHSISSGAVTDVYPDFYGNTWFCTEKGLDYRAKHRLNVKVYDRFPNMPNDKQMPMVLSGWYFEDNSSWVATWGRGLCRFDTSTGSAEYYALGKEDNDTYVNDVCRVGDELWLGNYNGLQSFDPATKTIKTFKNDKRFPAGMSTFPILHIFKSPDGTIWLSSNEDRGIFHYTDESGRFEHYGLHETGKNRFPFRNVSTFAADEMGNLWMGYNRHSGLVYYDKKRAEFDCFFNGKDGVPDQQVNCLVYHDRRLWIGTNNGLYCYDLVQKKADHFTRSEGLVSNNINRLAADGKGNIWIATDNGLSVLSSEYKTVQNYSYKDGLPSDLIEDIKYDDSGRLYGIAGKALFILPDEGIFSKHQISHPVFTSLLINGQPRGIPDGQGLSLGAEEEYITFQYTSPVSPTVGRVYYRHKLAGFDSKWVPDNEDGKVTYASLPAGRYSLTVQSSLDGIYWQSSTDSLRILVIPPFYKRLWFLILCIFLSILLVASVLIVYYRIKLQRLHMLERVRHEIASDLHDDLGSTLSSISLMSEMAKRKASQADAVSAYLDEIGSNSRRLVAEMSDIVWNISPANDGFESLVIRTRKYAASILEPLDIRLEFSVMNHLSFLQCSLRDRKNIYLVFKEILNNICKHSHAGSVAVDILQEGNQIVFRVKDDGKGFDKEQVEYGNGLKNIYARASELKASFEVNTKSGNGTEYRLSVPLSNFS